MKIGITGIIQSSPNANDGNAQVNLLEGTPPFYYHWRGDHGVEASTASISGLASGLYCVTVTNGCTQDEACIDLRDCSEKGPRLTENITHTCPGGYEAGSIKLGIEGGKQPFAFVWNNGATTQNLENLGFGIFCVTVTDADGCVATGCFEVLSTQEFADKIDHDGSYCYVSTYCNNLSVAQSDIQALDCNYDDPSNCTTLNCYCPLDNSQVTSTSTGYSSYMVDPASCTLRGLCPGSGGWEIVENGYFETQSFFTYCAGSFCGTCHYVTYCVFDLGTYIASEYSTPATVDCEFPAPWCSEMGSNQWYSYYCDSSQPVTGHCGIPNRVVSPALRPGFIPTA